MACTMYTQSENSPEEGALDQLRKAMDSPVSFVPGLNCLVPGAASRVMEQWLQLSINFSYYTNKSKQSGTEDLRKETQEGSKPHRGPNKTCRKFEPASATARRQSPEGIPHHNNDFAMRRSQSPTSSTRSSPANGCYRTPAFPGTRPDACLQEPCKSMRFNPHFGSDQLTLNAWWTGQRATSPSSTITTFSPDRTTIGEESSDVQRCVSSPSSSVSPADRCSLSSPDLHATPSIKRPYEAPEDNKNTAYKQKRIKNNIAAKKSRDLRREREDRIAQECGNMHKTLDRVKHIRAEYLRVLDARGLHIPQPLP